MVEREPHLDKGAFYTAPKEASAASRVSFGSTRRVSVKGIELRRALPGSSSRVLS